MTTYTMAWGWDDTDESGQNTVHLTDIADVDAALTRAAADGPVLLDVYEGTWSSGDPLPDYGLQLVWGHPERAAVTWLGDRPGYAVETTLSEYGEPIAHDRGEAPPYRTRVSSSVAQEVLREYVSTGSRPGGVEWVEE